MPEIMRRRCIVGIYAICCALIVGGCGFRPLYSQSTGGNAAALAAVEIDPIADRMGQKMRNLLRERMNPKGPPDRPLYRLSVKLTESKRELAVRKDESATRANLTVAASFSLVALKYPQLGAFSGNASSTNSYNVLDSKFATLGAENDARNRALIALSEELRLRVAAGLRDSRLFVPPDAPSASKRPG